jgi:hypothetical protein
MYKSGLFFLLSILFHHDSACSYITWGMNSMPVGGRSSETYFHTIDMFNQSINQSISQTYIVGTEQSPVLQTRLTV